MIHTIIFDLGNVLVGFGWEKFLREIAPEDKDYLALERAIFRNPAWVEHDKGLLTEQEELAEFISAAPEYEAQIRQAYENLSGCVWNLPYTVPWLQELKAEGFRIYALSNWPKHVYDLRGARLDFLELMDGYILSFREHVIKPDPEIYRRLLERYDIRPEEAVFLDDTLKNVEGAERLGIRGIHFRNLGQAKEELEKLGVGTKNKESEKIRKNP